MADEIGSWGDATFRNVTSLLSKSPAWQKYFPKSPTDWKPTAGAFDSTPGSDPLAGYKLAASGDIKFPGMFTASETSQPSIQTTPYTPTGEPVAADFYDRVGALQTQNFGYSQELMDRNAGLAQGYANQLLGNARDLRNLDFQLGSLARYGKEFLPSTVQAIAATQQAMQNTAADTENSRLTAINDAAYKMAMANRIPRSGIA